jgi:glycogen(starch) synthase
MPDYVFEVSSEAGRKIGGIYTVLQSKSRYLVEKYGEGYMLIGMDDGKQHNDFKPAQPPKPIALAMEKVREKGVDCKYGKWAYGNNASLVLIDAKRAADEMMEYAENGGEKTDKAQNYWKFLLWKHYGVDSLMEASWDFTENAVWGFGVGMFLEELLLQKPYSGSKCVGQFHEWISGAALLYCNMKKLPIATVFTTHATVLGRTLSSFGRDVLSEASSKEQINTSEAYHFKVEGKHNLEAACARECTVLTTVSETVGEEVEYILGRKPDVITVNGFDVAAMEKENDVANLATYMHSELVQFAESIFLPYYQMDYTDAILTYISGRYEFQNKGFDIYIEALGKLNERLKKRKSPKRIIAFIFAPSAVREPKVSIIKNYLLLDKITEVTDQLGACKDGTCKNLRDRLSRVKNEEKKRMLEAMAGGFIREGAKPPISCFELNYSNDIMLKACSAAGLENREEDAVKVIFYPTYAKPNDGLLDMSYYDMIGGMDIGIFPSRYEPFGYTPLEAGLKLNIAITSDMTGFGRYMSKKANLQNRGLVVLHMMGKSKDAAVDELASELERMYLLDRKGLRALQHDAYELVKLADWKDLIKNYFDAYELAERKFYK